MNKKILLSMITVCLILVGCAKEVMPQRIGQSSSAPTLSDSLTSSEQLKSILAKYTTNQIVFFQSFTIGDNRNAAFAVTRYGSYSGDVWYVTISGAQELKSGVNFPSDGQPNAPVLWTVDGTIIFKCEDDGGGSSSISYA